MNTNSWDTFWSGSQKGDALQTEPAQAAALSKHWEDVLNWVSEGSHPPMAVLDLCGGTGTIARRVKQHFNDVPSGSVTYYCSDLSEAAVKSTIENDDFHGVVADAATLPFAEGSIDLLVSQFGVEYAGLDAILEVPKLLSQSGAALAVIHKKEGEIDQECRRNKLHAEALKNTMVLENATIAISEIATLKSSTGQAIAQKQSRDSLAKSVQSLEDLIRTSPTGIAGGLSQHLYDSLRAIFSHLNRYQPDDIHAWCRRYNHEVDAYIQRMDAMMQAALSEVDFNTCCSRWQESGLSINPDFTGQLLDDARPIAWRLTARRVR